MLPDMQDSEVRRVDAKWVRSATDEHAHWNWARKATALRYAMNRCVGLTYRRQLQGLMMVSLGARNARLPSQFGRPLVYIKYLEVAPWNLGDKPRFSRVGRALLRTAVELSFAEGFGGRVGLHSLPQSEGFYVSQSLEALGIDPSEENLRYFELTEEMAIRIRKGESSCKSGM